MAQPAAVKYDAPDKPEFSAFVVYPKYVPITVTQLYDTLKKVAPNAEFGDWSGPFKARPADAAGTNMLSIDGIRLSILNANAALPEQFYDPGPIGNIFLPDAMLRLRVNKAHTLVIPARAPESRAEGVASARAVALLTWAVALCANAPAFKWVDSDNVVPIRVLDAYGPNLAKTGGDAIPLWVRILAGLGPKTKNGHPTTLVGTFGLWAFGAIEVEFQPFALPPEYVVPRAYAVCDYILKSAAPLKDGDSFQLDDTNIFRIEEKSSGTYTNRRTLHLSWLDRS